MNSTSLATANGTPNQDKNGRPQGVGAASHQLTLGPAPVPKQKPTIAQLRNAMDAFNIRGTCRLVAYELLSYWEPGGQVFPLVKTIAAGIGKSERVVQRQLDRLERIGLWVRVGPAPVGRPGRHPSLYELRLPKSPTGDVHVTRGVTPTSPRSNQREVVQPPPDKMSAETPKLPEHLEAIEGGRFVKCGRCQHDWPRAAGLSHRCIVRSDRPKRMARAKARPNRAARTADRSRSETINAARLDRIRSERGNVPTQRTHSGVTA